MATHDVLPRQARFWKFYAEHHERAGNVEAVGAVLKRALVASAGVDLWRYYVSFTQRTKLPTGGEADSMQMQAARKQVVDAYEYAIDNVGNAINAQGLYKDFVEFQKTGDESNEFAASQKLQDIRRAYQLAIIRPHHGLDDMWRDYSAFENEFSPPQLAQEKIARFQPLYRSAQAVFKELRPLYQDVNLNMTALPSTSGEREQKQARLWAAIMRFEKTNPLRLEDATKHARVRAVFRQCLEHLRHFPDVWFERLDYELREANDAGMAAEALTSAVEAVPGSQIIGFASADFYELQKNLPRATEEYERMLKECPGPLVFIQYQRFARRTSGTDKARAVFKKARKSEHCSHHVFVDNAHLEYYANKEADVARRIFEAGLKKFPKEPQLVLHYIEFLTHLNDDNSE